MTDSKIRGGPPGVFALERHQQILDRLRAVGRLDASELAASFGVSTETVRRDLIALEHEGLLRRVHGGAILESQHRRVPDVRQRAVLMTEEKEAIGQAATDLVPTGGLVLVDAGTTTRALARVFPVDPSSTVVTPSLLVAMELLERSAPTVHTLGGHVNHRTWSESGSWTRNVLSAIRAEVAFLGASGIVAAEGATTSDDADAEVKRGMIRSARKVVVLCDSSKVGSIHLATFADLSEIDVLITGAVAAAGELAAIREAGVEVITV